ncbi:MAG: hypothetical protein OK456_06960 [Thaumarchaeota archaeon]|nr:hypothetical protein [Nitrososphaerota archaeon]
MRGSIVAAAAISFALLLSFSSVGAALSVVSTIDLGNTGSQGPPIYNPSNRDIYVSNLGTLNAGSISVISTSSNMVVANITLGPNTEPEVGVLDTSNGNLYVPDVGDTVYVLSGTTNTIAANITIAGNGLEAPAFDPSNGMIYVPSLIPGTVSIIDTSNNSVIKTIDFPGPEAAVFDSSNGEVYIPTFQGIYSIAGSNNAVVGNVPLSSGVTTPVVDTANGDVYVPTGANSLLVLSQSNAVLANVTVGSVRATPLFDPINGDVYVPTNEGSMAVVSAVSNRLIANISLGGTTETPAIDSGSGELYATVSISGSSQSNVTVISGTSILTSMAVGSGAETGFFDAGNGDLYVPEEVAGAVSVIAVGTSSTQVSGTGSSSNSSLSNIPVSFLFMVATVAAIILVAAPAVRGRIRLATTQISRIFRAERPSSEGT